MAVASAPDLALLRADAGLIIKVTDALLSDSVCSHRPGQSLMDSYLRARARFERGEW